MLTKNAGYKYKLNCGRDSKGIAYKELRQDVDIEYMPFCNEFQGDNDDMTSILYALHF